jgi:peptidyl-prolyl cis-trans isomerase-like 4
MSVLVTTSQGDLVFDLYFDKCPLAVRNFISLCRIKYYNNCLFFNIQQDFMIQSGDPTNTGNGGHSIFHLIRQQKDPILSTEVYFNDELHKELKHNRAGLLCMANKNAKNTNASQFYITTTNRHLEYLDGTHTIFGEVAEGLDDILMEKLNTAFTDLNGKPIQPIRIKHTSILFDPFENEPLAGLEALIPVRSPSPINDDVNTTDLRAEKLTEDQLVEKQKEKETRSRAVVLEMIGDIADADQKPPDNILFVCKLNPYTNDDDLKLIFSKFGRVGTCEVIRDRVTGDSLCYAFVEFETKDACEEAYFKMENVLIDDRRIHVDFSQSVSKLWNKHRRSKLRGGEQSPRRDEEDYRQERRKEKFEYKYEKQRQHGDKTYDLLYEDEKRDHKKRKRDDDDDRKRKHDRKDSINRRDRSSREDDDDGRYNKKRHYDSRSRDYR